MDLIPYKTGNAILELVRPGSLTKQPRLEQNYHDQKSLEIFSSIASDKFHLKEFIEKFKLSTDQSKSKLSEFICSSNPYAFIKILRHY